MEVEPYTSSSDALLADLNPAQRDAVTHPPGPLLVVAGAGTGKTRVLTRRVGWLIRQGVPPWRLLAITFTNKAAGVLCSRLAEMGCAEGVWAGTFHGFGAFLLRRHADEIGLDPRFTILDREDQLRLLKTLLDDLPHGKGELKPNVVSSMISHVKNGAGGRAPLDLRRAETAVRFEQLMRRYGERLRAASLLDFDDLLLEPVRLLEEVPEVAALYRERFDHVLVDEYQDTNLIQRDLVLRLVGEAGRVCVVGDPDQSIYRWRGAAVRNILDFERDFPGARRVLLEQNYRSTGTILSAAEAVIAENRDRYEKRLFTRNPPGDPVAVHRCQTAAHEGLTIADQIDTWVRAGARHDDIAVFYRVNALSRTIETSLKGRGIPYAVVAGVEFFQRREVKDLLAYARLVQNPRDDAAFLRIVNVPRRGVGKGSLDKLRAAAQARGLSVAAVAGAGDAGISGRARTGLQRLHALLAQVGARPRSPVAPLLKALAEGSTYRAHLEDNPDPIERGRLENLDELVAFAREYDLQEPGGDLEGFLERAALVSDQDGYEEETGRVSLMSVHAAKGLEFPCVLIAGAENGYFPHARSVDDEQSAEEERRLFYVAMTRAERHLTVTLATQRQTYMGLERRRVTPYLRAVPREHLAVHDQAFSGTPFLGTSGADRDPGDGFVREESPDELPVVRSLGLPFEPGERVLHPLWGRGEVFDVLSKRGGDFDVVVDFDAVGRRQMQLRYANLEKIE